MKREALFFYMNDFHSKIGKKTRYSVHEDVLYLFSKKYFWKKFGRYLNIC